MFFIRSCVPNVRNRRTPVEGIHRLCFPSLPVLPPLCALLPPLNDWSHAHRVCKHRYSQTYAQAACLFSLMLYLCAYKKCKTLLKLIVHDIRAKTAWRETYLRGYHMCLPQVSSHLITGLVWMYPHNQLTSIINHIMSTVERKCFWFPWGLGDLDINIHSCNILLFPCVGRKWVFEWVINILWSVGLHETLALLTSQLHPDANHKEDLVFLKDVFSEKSLGYLMKVQQICLNRNDVIFG